jgi:hypothetical protein
LILKSGEKEVEGKDSMLSPGAAEIPFKKPWLKEVNRVFVQEIIVRI